MCRKCNRLLLLTQDSSSAEASTDQANLTSVLTQLLANPDPKQIQNLAGMLSSSQQNQLEDLLKQVKTTDQVRMSDNIETNETELNYSLTRL